LEHKATTSSFDVARYYDKQKAYRAAVIYYNEVIRQQPGSTESEKAKKRIDQLRQNSATRCFSRYKKRKRKKEKHRSAENEERPGKHAFSKFRVHLAARFGQLTSTTTFDVGDTTAPPASSTEPEGSATPSSPDDSGSSEATASPTP